MKPGASKVRLRIAVPVEHVVVLLPCPIAVREMDEPVAPALWIVDRERTYVRCATSKRSEHKSFGSTKPSFVAHSPFKRREACRGHTEKIQAGRRVISDWPSAETPAAMILRTCRKSLRTQTM